MTKLEQLLPNAVLRGILPDSLISGPRAPQFYYFDSRLIVSVEEPVRHLAVRTLVGHLKRFQAERPKFDDRFENRSDLVRHRIDCRRMRGEHRVKEEQLYPASVSQSDMFRQEWCRARAISCDVEVGP